jgi:DNA-binding NarL/FixJ family response regulator
MSAAVLRVGVADDDALMREFLRALIDGDAGLELAGLACDADEAAELARAEQPDVMVLDWVMPGGGGPAAARQILEDCPEVRVVALTSSDGGEASMDMLRAGAKSFLVKGAPPPEIVNGIKGVMRL